MKFSWGSAVAGAAALIVVAFVLGAFVIYGGYAPVNADSRPPKIESKLAMTALHKAVDRLQPASEGPLPATDANLTAGAKGYAQNCAVCHGASDGRETTVAAGLYQRPPQFAKDGVDDDPASETYWKVKHGIRFTGMPAFSATLSENELWQIALFAKHLPNLPPHAQAAWKAMKAPGVPAPSRG